MELNNKIALVTGAGTGVGRATALQLAAGGCAVVVNYSRSAKGAEETAAAITEAGGRALVHRADVAEDAEVKVMVHAAVDEFGGLDILINNAGVTDFIPFQNLDGVDDEVWDRLMKVNVVGAFHCARAAAAVMKDGGEIVNVSSVAGIAAMGSCIPYAASKAALNNMTVALARTLAPKIRVNAVAPGFITGDWLKRGLGEHYEAVKAAFEAKMPLGRVCDPGDVADAILSLITGSDLVTGQILRCDGGHLIAEPVGI